MFSIASSRPIWIFGAKARDQYRRVRLGYPLAGPYFLFLVEIAENRLFAEKAFFLVIGFFDNLDAVMAPVSGEAIGLRQGLFPVHSTQFDCPFAFAKDTDFEIAEYCNHCLDSNHANSDWPYISLFE